MTTLTSASTPPVGTFHALQNANFRTYFIGQLISISGTWMQNLAQGYLVFQLTRSEAWLGIVACAAGLPIVLMSPLTGVLVERFPRRQLLYSTQICQMLFALLLAFLTATGEVQVWHIVGLALLLGATNAVDVPARWAIVSELVSKEDLRSGIALNSMLNSGARVLGPVVAGLVLVRFGPALCFFLNALSFLAAMTSLTLIRIPYEVPPARSVDPLAQLRAGFAFVRRDDVVRVLLLLALIGGAFVIPLLQLMPAFADVVLNSPEEGFAALSAAQGVGSVGAGALIGWLAGRLGFHRIIPLATFWAGAGMMLLAAQTTVITAGLVSLFVGFFMILQFIAINTTLQLIVPSEYRGRVLALYTLSFTGIAPFGALLLGLIANVIGTPWALALYGVLSAALGLALWQRAHISGRVRRRLAA
jgi:MFS family permease